MVGENLFVTVPVVNTRWQSGEMGYLQLLWGGSLQGKEISSDIRGTPGVKEWILFLILKYNHTCVLMEVKK